jgi:hypothetical protein
MPHQIMEIPVALWTIQVSAMRTFFRSQWLCQKFRCVCSAQKARALQSWELLIAAANVNGPRTKPLRGIGAFG